MTPETPRIWLTLRCSMRCWFCSTRVHDHVGNWPEADELDAVQWHARIAALPGRDVVLTGGEPSLHRDFLAIVGGSPKPMYVYSNFARSDVLDTVPPGLPIHWRASFHGTTANDLGAWVDRVTAMHDKGYKVTATTVYPPEGLVKAIEEHGIIIDTPQSPLPPKAGRVACTLPRILIAPNGERYHCVTRLARRDPHGIVRHDRPSDATHCEAATGCLACDFTAARGKQ